VLSHGPRQQLQDLRRAYRPALDQTDGHAQIIHHVCIESRFAGLECRSGTLPRKALLACYLGPLTVLHPLFELAFSGLVVLRTSLTGVTLTMLFPATEWAPQIPAAGIAWMGQKKNPAMPTTRQTVPEARVGPQHGPEHEIVLQHQVPDLAPAAVPTRPELKVLLDFNDQKPSVSLMILICLDTASSYTIDTPCVERWDEAFFAACRQPAFSSWEKQ
jgi:hypothetical protein